MTSSAIVCRKSENLVIEQSLFLLNRDGDVVIFQFSTVNQLVHLCKMQETRILVHIYYLSFKHIGARSDAELLGI